MYSKERIEKWDYLKFILILLVVLGHISDYYVDKSTMMRMVFIAIYTFHMPLFIFLSGMFAKRNIEEKRYSKIFSFFILYVVIKIILCISNMFILNTFAFNLFTEGGAPWYALAIFIQCLITIALSRFSKKYVLLASVVFACILGLDSSVTDFLAISRVFVYYPFFFLGYSLKPEKVSRMLNKRWIKISSVILLLFFVTGVVLEIDHLYWSRPLLTGRNPFSALGDKAKYGPLLRLLYYVGVTIIGAAVIALIPDKINNRFGKWASEMGRKTLQIYALHYPLIKIFVYTVPLYDIIRKILPEYTLLYAFPLALAITVVCGLNIFTKLFNRIVFPKIEK